MPSYIKTLLALFLAFPCFSCLAQPTNAYNAIYSGIPWFDTEGKVVSAHGACILKDNNRYYLFGEAHTDTSNAFAGFTCYSSSDLYTWKFESMALPVQPSGKLGPNRVGERVKVMQCPGTGEYVMYMHVDTLGYRDQFVGYATANNITGPYTFRGPLLFDGKPVRKWDMGTFRDSNGTGYVLLHGGDIYRLSEDYKSITEQVSKSFDRELEAPTLFRKDSLYYFLGSHLSSWEKNDNYYFTAPSLKGPWTKQGLLAPAGTLTWYSQTTFVLPVQGSEQTTYLFMGDRWSFPKQASAASYVWQPLVVNGTLVSLPVFLEAWQLNTGTGKITPVHIGKKTIRPGHPSIRYSGNWQQDTVSFKTAAAKGASFTMKFKGVRVGMYGLSRPDGGYARVRILNRSGKTVLSSLIDLYCKYPVTGLKFLSPVLTRGNYTLEVTVLGERGNWSDKRQSIYGSTGYTVSLEKLVINE